MASSNKGTYEVKVICTNCGREGKKAIAKGVRIVNAQEVCDTCGCEVWVRRDTDPTLGFPVIKK